MRNTRQMTVIFALVLLALLPVTASAKVRALFVGIDTYKYASAEGEFSNLQGTVNDVGHIKAALQSVYGWALDQPVDGQCKSANAVSITLTNACATRDAMLAALAEQIQASAPGDTVIFYYAGHGSQVSDSQHFREASGMNDSILPYDARGPDETVPIEILDEEINVIIENARNVQGVNMVTIFDSCDSATGQRGQSDGQSREAGWRQLATRRPLARLAPQVATTPGYRVHLAAAADGEPAKETKVGRSPTPSGVFTTALVAAIHALPGASFADLIEEARRHTETLGHGSQHPAAEGALGEGFEGGGNAALLLAARREGRTVRLTAGTLSGMTQGSSFALYDNWTDARDAIKPALAHGHIASVDIDSANVAIDPPVPHALPLQLVARETRHVFGDLQIKVRVHLPDDGFGSRERLIESINALPYAKVVEPAEIELLTYGNGRGETLAFTTDGDGIADLPPMADPSLPADVTKVLAKRARVDALLALRTDPTLAQLDTCIDTAPFPVSNGLVCRPIANDPAAMALRPMLRSIMIDHPAYFAVANAAAKPRFVYVFLIEQDSKITLLTPQDAPLAPHRVLLIPFSVHREGFIRLLVLATPASQPINAAALEQGTSARNVASCSSVLEKLLCQARTGARNPAAARTGPWAAIVVSADATFPRPKG